MARKVLPYSDFKRLVGDAIAAGAQPRGNGSLQWDISNGCSNPFDYTVRCFDSSHTQHRYVDLSTPCRKCERCLKLRGAHWRLRMQAEISAAKRSWLVTLTASPERHAWLDMAADMNATRRGLIWAEMSDEERFRYCNAAAGPELTKYVKRLRERSPGALRLCLVTERHKSGRPHWHALIHEADEAGTRHRHIKESWRWGFSDAKLVTDHRSEKTAWYVAKYISKSSLSRVRASRGYGQPNPTGWEQNPTPAGDGPAREKAGEKTSTHAEQSVGQNWADFIASLRNVERSDCT